VFFLDGGRDGVDELVDAGRELGGGGDVAGLFEISAGIDERP